MTSTINLVNDQVTQAKAELIASQEAHQKAQKALKAARQADEKAVQAYDKDQSGAAWTAKKEAREALERATVDEGLAAKRVASASESHEQACRAAARSERDALVASLSWQAFRESVEPLAKPVLEARNRLLQASESFNTALTTACEGRNAAIAKAQEAHARSRDACPLGLDSGDAGLARLIVYLKVLMLDASAKTPIDPNYLALVTGEKPTGSIRVAEIGAAAECHERTQKALRDERESQAYARDFEARQRAKNIEACVSQIHKAELEAKAMVPGDDLNALTMARRSAGVSYLKQKHQEFYGIPFKDDLTEAFRGTDQ